jgi:hypothetical protein
MCIVTTPEGLEIICPEPVYLDSDNVGRTVKFLIAESQLYKMERKFKKDLRQAKRRKPFWK